MLYRRERIDILSQRQDDNTARMLSGAPPDTGTTRYNAVDFTVPFSAAPLFVVPLDITVCSLVCQCANGSRAVSLSRAKNNFRILVSLTLVFSRKVQIDIRLFVSFKPQKSLKGNIKSVLFQRLPAYGTQLIRHIAACPSRILSDFL